MGSTTYDGFSLTRGIRQGCPLSPLLFTAVSELLLRRLAALLPGTVNRAWADDLAMVVKDGLAHLPLLAATFDDFARLSGLRLHIGKTIAVPLFPHDQLQMQSAIAASVPQWAGVAIRGFARYLGLMVGPSKNDMSWHEPFQKYLRRARVWGQAGVGLHLSLRAYQTYVSSVLGFVMQLEQLPPTFEEYERKACVALFPGPHKRMHPDILRNLRAHGFPTELADFGVVSVAARSRVCRTEALKHGGLQVHARARRLRSIVDGCADHRFPFVASFAHRTFLFQVASADKQVEQCITQRTAAGTLPPRYVRWQEEKKQDEMTRCLHSSAATSVSVAQSARSASIAQSQPVTAASVLMNTATQSEQSRSRHPTSENAPDGHFFRPPHQISLEKRHSGREKVTMSASLWKPPWTPPLKAVLQVSAGPKVDLVEIFQAICALCLRMNVTT